jgi:hypothetical protein
MRHNDQLCESLDRAPYIVGESVRLTAEALGEQPAGPFRIVEATGLSPTAGSLDAAPIVLFPRLADILP